MTLRNGIGVVLLLLLTITSTGCNIIGAAAQVLPPPNTAASYSIKGQSVGVMVWVDRAVALDFPNLRADLAKTIQLHLDEAAKAKSKDLELTTFLNPGRVVQYQEMHPEFEAIPITEVAPKLAVSKVIYVEVTRFETSSSLYLLKGNAIGTLQVIECSPDKKGRVVFTADLQSGFPPSPSDGVPGDATNTTRTIYEGTVAQLGGDIAEKFYSHPDEK